MKSRNPRGGVWAPVGPNIRKWPTRGNGFIFITEINEDNNQQRQCEIPRILEPTAMVKKRAPVP